MASAALAADGVACYRSGKHEEAASAFGKALALSDGDEEKQLLLKNRAAAFAARGDWQACEKDLSAAIALAESDAGARCLLKRSYCRSQLERHAQALEDAEAAVAALPSGGSYAERAKSQLLRCRATLRADEEALTAEAGDAAAMVHPQQTLRFNLCSAIPERVEAGDEIDVVARLGNEFGLWRPRDWRTVVATAVVAKLSFRPCTSFVAASSDDFVQRTAIDESGRVAFRCRVPPAGGAVTFVVEADGEGWRRRPLALLSLPIFVVGSAEGEDSPLRALHAEATDLGVTCCRRVGDVVVAEAPGTLGIGGKLWDASFALLRLLGRRFRFTEDAVILELGAGVGAVGLACASAATRVIVTDVKDVVPLLALNAKLNGSRAEACELDWFRPPTDLRSYFRGPSPNVVLLADVVYDPALHAPLLDTLARVFADLDPVLVLLAHRHRNPHDDDFFRPLHRTFALEAISLDDDDDAPEDDVKLFALRRRGDAPPPLLQDYCPWFLPPSSSATSLY